MNIALSDIGEKLSAFRKTLSLSQKDMAEAMGVHQSQLSKIELGVGGSIELLLHVLNYYGTNYQLRYTIADSFDIVAVGEGDTLASPYSSIAAEKLSLLQVDINTQFQEVQSLLSKSML